MMTCSRCGNAPPVRKEPSLPVPARWMVDLPPLAAVRSEHLATFPDAGPREEGTAADTAPAPDVRRTVKRGGRRSTRHTAGIGRGGSHAKPARRTPPNRSRQTQTDILPLPE